MREALRKRIIAYNRDAAKNKEAAADFRRLLDALPPGQIKQLLRDEACCPILEKYGITAGNE